MHLVPGYIPALYGLFWSTMYFRILAGAGGSAEGGLSS